MRAILHVDMDAFYASVEQRDDPSLVGKPVIVGGPSRRGVVCAASYEVRRFGVRSAMPMVEAMRRCPSARVLAPRMAHYAEVSREVFRIFRRYTPLVEGLSLDEAFLDVTESRALFGDGATIAKKIKDAIWDELRLRASAGVATSKFVAKIASDLEKPDGLTVVPADVEGFLAPLPIEKMWGIGAKTAPLLRSHGLRTLGDLARADPRRLREDLGAWGDEVPRLARGLDERPVVPGREAKSVGAEETFERDVHDREVIARHLLEQSMRVAERLVRDELAGRTLTLKLKLADFSVITRQVTLGEPTYDTQTIYRAASALLDEVPLDRRGVRLSGVSVSGLSHGAAQATLFPEQARERSKTLTRLFAAVHDKFGDKAVTYAELVDDDEA